MMTEFLFLAIDLFLSSINLKQVVNQNKSILFLFFKGYRISLVVILKTPPFSSHPVMTLVLTNSGSPQYQKNPMSFPFH